MVRFLLKDNNRKFNFKENECVLTKSNKKRDFFNKRSYGDIDGVLSTLVFALVFLKIRFLAFFSAAFFFFQIKSVSLLGM